MKQFFLGTLFVLLPFLFFLSLTTSLRGGGGRRNNGGDIGQDSMSTIKKTTDPENSQASIKATFLSKNSESASVVAPSAVIGQGANKDRLSPGDQQNTGAVSPQRAERDGPMAAAARSLSSTQCQPLKGEPTSCPLEDRWLKMWAAKRPANHHWILVDVGANKGYSIGGMLEVLGSRKYSRDYIGVEVFAYAEKEDKTPASQWMYLCGACCDCADMPDDAIVNDSKANNNNVNNEERKSEPSVTVYAYDGSLVHYNFLRHAFRNHPNITVYHAAVSSMSGSTTFSEGFLGVEKSSVAKPNSPNSRKKKKAFTQKIHVPLVDLDTNLSARLPYIDVLLTDTEGFDYFVAQGARQLLQSGRVGMYVFELLGRLPIGLKIHVQRMQEWGYACYFPLQGSKLPYSVIRIKGGVRLISRTWLISRPHFSGPFRKIIN